MQEYRRLGNSDLNVSVIGLGTMPFGAGCDAETSAAVVNAALDAGVNFIDTADIYGGGLAEEYIGRALGARRKNIIIATKGSIRRGEGRYWSDASRAYLTSAAEASLRRLGTDYIDLYQVHMPDPKTPIEDTLGALDDLVKSGKVRHVGCVNYGGWQVTDAAWAARTRKVTPFVSSQNRYNIFDREPETEQLPACAHFGLSFIPFLPLAGGLLTGKYRAGQPPPDGSRLAGGTFSRQVSLSEQNLATVARLEAVAVERGHTLLELAMGWLLAKPLVASVIAGATKPSQATANAAAAAWKMTADDLAAVEAAFAGTSQGTK
jgi:aryl-alcohol dehydrogenase-like predicted oxidoreductase